MSLLLLILIFLFKNIEAGREGCNSYPDNSKIYECNDCTPGYNKMHCPDSNCVICFKCEITYCNECTGNVCSKCLDVFYLKNNQCLFFNSYCKTCSGSAYNCDSCYDGYYMSYIWRACGKNCTEFYKSCGQCLSPWKHALIIIYANLAKKIII